MNPIIATARSYIGTRFHHQGRLKKAGNSRGGVDCLGLLVGVAGELDLRGKNGERLADLDERDYSHQPDAERLRAMLSASLHEVSAGRWQEADIALFEIDGRAQHMGVLSSPSTNNQQPATDFSLIHAYAPARAVVEHALDEHWQKKIVGVFSLPITRYQNIYGKSGLRKTIH